MKLILTRDQRGVVERIELDGVTFNDRGRVEIPNVMAVQVTDTAHQRPVVGVEFGIFEGLELVHAGPEDDA